MFLSNIRITLYAICCNLQSWKLRHLYGIDIGKGTLISRKANIDKSTNPKGIHIGKYTRITGGVIVLAHDECRKIKKDTFIGDNCFIGTRSIIMPGVRIGNQVIIGAGSVVTKDIPDNCIAAGNPAKIIKQGISCKRWGQIN